MGVSSKMMQLASAVASKVRLDGWSNVLTGLGIAGRDKRMSMAYQWNRKTESDLEHLYASDDVARRVVDYVPDEGTRQWIELRMKSGDESLAEMIAEEHERLQVKEKFNEAWKWARLYGGAGLLIAVDDGRDLEEPLDLGALRTVKSLTLLNRFELNTQQLITDLEHPEFGNPLIYMVSPRTTTTDIASLMVHHTRIIRFDGIDLPRRLKEVNDYWSDSVLSKMENVLRNYNGAHDSTAAALQDFRLMVLKMKNLASMIGSDDDKALLARLQLMNMSKSVLNSVVVDADSESIDHIATNFTNIDKVLEKVEARLVAASDLPHTVVLGEGAAGTLSGGGESEDDNAKDYVAAHQRAVLEKPINRINEIIMSARRGPTSGRILEDLTWDFRPLWQMSEKEKAEIHKAQAEADAIYLDRGVLAPETVAKSRFGGSEYSTETRMEEGFVEPTESTEQEKEETDPEKDPNVDSAEPHAHYLSIKGVGSGYTSEANGDDANHTHTMPNGAETGPRIELFGGDHVHQVAVGEFSSPSFSTAIAKEAQSLAVEPEEQTIELEYDTKTGKLVAKGVDPETLLAVLVSKEAAKTADEASKVADRFIEPKAALDVDNGYRFKVRDAADFKPGTIRAYRTPTRGVKILVGERA
jgi:phage-related protein (TIGR01555 family)